MFAEYMAAVSSCVVTIVASLKECCHRCAAPSPPSPSPPMPPPPPVVIVPTPTPHAKPHAAPHAKPHPKPTPAPVETCEAFAVLHRTAAWPLCCVAARCASASVHAHSCSSGSPTTVLICAAITLGAAQRGAITASSVLGCLHLSKLKAGEVSWSLPLALTLEAEAL